MCCIWGCFLKRTFRNFFPQVSPHVLHWIYLKKKFSSIKKVTFCKVSCLNCMDFCEVWRHHQMFGYLCNTHNLGSIILATGGLPNFLINLVRHPVWKDGGRSKSRVVLVTTTISTNPKFHANSRYSSVYSSTEILEENKFSISDRINIPV